jgi:predicted unusual protein kinase regulating ubiquinone biosynthesis (AarF/ABC1/UbiB family)
VLLDFGAAMPVSDAITVGYRNLLKAGLNSDRAAVRDAAMDLGFFSPAALERHPAVIDRMIGLILEQTDRAEDFDFGDRSFLQAVRGEGMQMVEDRAVWHVPPADTLFVQRKISGMALLAARLKARVGLRGLVEARLAQ